MSHIFSKEFTFWSLMKFVAPTIIMLVFMAMYTMVDGIFVANLIGENALSAVNIIYPLISVVCALAIMLASGGSAVIAAKMGEGKYQEAKENFTLIILTGIIVGLLILVLSLTFIEPIIKALGSTDVLHDYCYDYAIYLIPFMPFALLQMLFQLLFVTAGKAKIGLLTTVLGGIANIVLDYTFIKLFDMGISGAALATSIGYSIPAIHGLIYFSIYKKGSLHFVKPRLDWMVLVKSCANGSSEMVTNLATAITTLLFNIVMIKYLGEDGVAAITIVLYAQFLLTAVYLGFSAGISPVISYNYGNKNYAELKKIVRISLQFILSSSIFVYALSILLASNIVNIFVSRDSTVFNIALNGFFLFAISFLFSGFNIFASSLFTALANGKVSAIISFLRTFVFIIFGITVLPELISTNGIWLAVPFAEILTLGISYFYISKLKHFYHYA